MPAREQTSQPLLLVADRIETLDPAAPTARAVMCDRGRVRWVGSDPADAPTGGTAPRRIDLDGAVVYPAFVDAHAHLTVTGLTLGGLDLAECESLDDCLATVRAVADVLPGPVIWGSGWDDFDWPERRPPNADELARASGGRPVLLFRADGHSAVVDRVSLGSAPFARAAGVDRDQSGQPTGLLRREANHLARRWFFAELEDTQLKGARELIARHAAGLGIASVHEMGGPDLLGERDFDAWLDGAWPIRVVPYWGDTDLDFVAARGLRQIGGSLLLDGTLGSRTAALEDDYADAVGRGYLYRETDELVAFTVEAIGRRIQPAFHCIGDRAVRQAVTVLELAAEATGADAVAAARPRLDLCELVPSELLPTMGRLGIVAVVGPNFDWMFGGRRGLYATRLGPERARRMNPFRPLVDAGVTLAFGSDAGVTPMDPWLMVDAAIRHSRPAFALDPADALRAAIVGGRHAAHQDDAGTVAPGMRADLAAFAGGAAGTGERGGPAVLTVVGGRVVHGPPDHLEA
jgi:predicted amidohydrolase YtcJ